MAIKAPKKLIEVALPLDAINVASAKEKSIRHGHPSTLHLWWARRPLAAARAVIFAQMVNDPGYERGLGRGVNKEKAAVERERLFKIIEDLVKWENTNNEEVLGRAREEIWKSWRETCRLNRDHPQAAELFNPDKLPAFHDPFAGGGALPLEAQRLGLESYASRSESSGGADQQGDDRNSAKIRGQAASGPRRAVGDRQTHCTKTGQGARGLAEDVRRYGAWMRDEAEKRIGHLYPKIAITAEMTRERPDLKPYVGKTLTVIAWLWARTVKSPNPAFGACRRTSGLDLHALQQGGQGGLCRAGDRRLMATDFTVKVGTRLRSGGGEERNDSSRERNFRCLMSGAPDHRRLHSRPRQGGADGRAD